MEELAGRVSRVCRALGIDDDDAVIRAYAEAYRHGFTGVACIRVRPDYYDLALNDRQRAIGRLCEGTSQLTKCLFYENRAAPEGSRDVVHSRFYLLIYQYQRKFSEPKFHTYIRGLKRDHSEYAHLTKQSYRYSYAEEATAKALCNADHNGMSPIGLVDMDIPVIIDSNITCEHVFVGGLHPFVKAKIQLDELIKNYKSYIADITDTL